MNFPVAISASASDSPFASFWENLSSATDLPPRWSGSSTFSFLFMDWSSMAFPWKIAHETDVAPQEKNIIDFPRGKLRAPKLRFPRGYKHLRLRNEFSGPHFK